MDASPIAALKTVFVFPHHAERILRPLDKDSATPLLRLMAFLRLRIGVQIPWDGLSELLEPWKLARH
jgi:small neutral amino acid transporter SnatA (MarC family)